MQIDRPIAIAVTLFVIALLVFFLVMPEYNTFKNLQLELGIKTAEYNAEKDYYAAIQKTYFDLQQKQDEIKKIDDALPQEPSVGKVIYFLQNASAENGMMIKSLSLSKASSGNSAVKNINEISFSLDMLGDYSSLEKFMVSLEKSARIFEITNISFSSSPAQATQSSQQFQLEQSYDFNIQIKTYSY